MISNTLQRKIKLFGLALSLVFSFTLLSTASVQAQMRRDRDDRRWENTNKRAVERLIKRVENRTDVFVKQVDRGLDNSRLDGSRREDNINELAQRFGRATSDLRREFDRSDSLQENRDEVQRVMDAASDIDRAIRRSRIGNGVRNSWRSLRSDLNALARAYSVRSI